MLANCGCSDSERMYCADCMPTPLECVADRCRHRMCSSCVPNAQVCNDCGSFCCESHLHPCDSCGFFCHHCSEGNEATMTCVDCNECLCSGCRSGPMLNIACCNKRLCSSCAVNDHNRQVHNHTCPDCGGICCDDCFLQVEPRDACGSSVIIVTLEMTIQPKIVRSATKHFASLVGVNLEVKELEFATEGVLSSRWLVQWLQSESNSSRWLR